MMRIFLFSGTTEGRMLSDLLTAKEISHTVCVATDNGKEMMEKNSYAEILVGRMDETRMRQLFAGEESAVIDATHPYATEVTENLKRAANATGAEYIRVLRDEAVMEEKAYEELEDITSCAKAVAGSEGNILLTTGSKELGRYMEHVTKEVQERTYVRVLPSFESIRTCEEAGLRTDHIIAMQGPFGREMNEALMRQYHIRHLITKDGGAAGGFREKLEAANACDVCVHVIARPAEEEGVGIAEAYRFITGEELPSDVYVPRITLVGMGMGNPKGLTIEASEALERADLVFGAERLLQDVRCREKIAKYKASDIIPLLQDRRPKEAVIVFSGDIGFYSGAKGMEQKLKEWNKDCCLVTLPGISSVSYLAAKCGESYEDAVLLSLHGKNEERDIGIHADRVRHNRKVFALLSGAFDVRRIAEKLLEHKTDAQITAGANLSYENESIRELSLEEALTYDEKGVISLLIRNNDPVAKPLVPVKSDDAFIRDKIPMTKACIRHESLIRLGLRAGDIFYDIGGGTGSVAIEAAGLDPSLLVTTIEKKKEAALLIQKNIEKSGLSNITLIEGEAESVLLDLEKPDCVFIGGSGGRLAEIISVLHKKGDGIRFVINAVSLETIEQTKRIIDTYKPADESAMMITVTDVEKVGSYHMMKGQNPVWIFSFTL